MLKEAHLQVLEFSHCSTLSSPGLFSVNSSCLHLLQHSASTTQLQESTRLHLGFPLCAVAWHLPHASLGFISFVSLFSRITLVCRPMSSVLHPVFSYILYFFFFGCFRWEVKSRPCYSILARGRNWHLLSF